MIRVETLIVCAMFAPPSTAMGQQGSAPSIGSDALAADIDAIVFDNDFARMGIEQLMNIQVTSVTGIEQEWFTTPAAVYVVTAEDIRKTGHQSIPEALRLVPGLQVARLNASTWAISSRGFNSRFANKLQVLLDGRSVYDPLFSGVIWDSVDFVLDDLDRIEVIRGPGATLWGANAVNGVINITTRSAQETHGWLFQGVAGDVLEAEGSVRYGAALSEDDHFRVFAKYRNDDESGLMGGGTAHDDWDMYRAGFRYDREGAEGTHITIDSAVYHTDQLGERVRVPLAPPAPPFSFGTATGDGRIEGAHVLVKASREDTATHSGWSLQTYYNRVDRAQGAGFQFVHNTFDMDFRHHFKAMENHEVLWGAGYRLVHDDTDASSFLSFEPSSRTFDTVSGFVQDTITLSPERLFAMIGSKFEHNDFTGFEVQPSGRIWWTPDDRQTLWAAVSRAVRTPSRADDDLRFLLAHTPFPPPNDVVVTRGDRDVDSENLTAYEIGYRRRLNDHVSIDLATFYNYYDDVIVVPTSGGAIDNVGRAEAYGAEAAITWAVADNWRLEGNYTFVNAQYHGPREGDAIETGSPENQFQIRSVYDVTSDLQFNAALYYVDQVPRFDIGSYFRLDLGLRWQVNDQIEIALWGQNLLDPSHPELSDPFFQAGQAEVPRSVYLEATVRF